jgi:hypothetical protein
MHAQMFSNRLRALRCSLCLATIAAETSAWSS